MPISDKILNEINRLNIDEKEKKLVLDILLVEEQGTTKYATEYDYIVKQYIKEQEAGEAR